MPRIRFATPTWPQCHFLLLLLLALFRCPQVGLGQDNKLFKFQPGRRQLLLDDYAISSMKHLTKTCINQRKGEPSLLHSDPGKSTLCRPAASRPGTRSETFSNYGQRD